MGLQNEQQWVPGLSMTLRGPPDFPQGHLPARAGMLSGEAFPL